LRDVLRETKNLEIIVAGRPGPNSKEIVANFDRLSQDFPRHVLCKFEFISEGDAHKLFCLADCLLVPYEHIDQSGVVSAAVHYGIPVVASDLEGFAETIDHGVNGFLFKRGDDKALAQILREIASNPYLIRIARNGMKDYSSRFIGWKEIAALHSALYEAKC
jgi:glycosyltransferase involved in cell wall biosynthesis